MPLAANAEPQRRLVGVLPLCFMLILGTLLLAACGDPPSLASETDQTPTTPQPVLSPRAAATEATTKAATPTTTATPVAPAFVQVAAGENHSCALQNSGRVQCWGANDDGQLDVPEGVSFQQITAGYRYSCGIRADGGVTCWGRNDHAQLDAPDGQFTAIDAGWDHVCALGGGTATCWGWNANERATPPTDVEFTAIGAGAEHSCGLTVSGALACWGKNDDGRADSRGGPFRAIAVGVAHTCVLRKDGTALCHGDNAAGQSDALKGPFSQITAGREHTCGLTSMDTIECWGGNVSEPTYKGLAVPSGLFTSIDAGWNRTCALTSDGVAKCWIYGSPAHPPPPYSGLNFVSILSDLSFEQPVDILPWTDRSLAIVERKGLISAHKQDEKSYIALDLIDTVDSEGSFTGLLSASLDPDFTRYPFLYIYYTTRVDDNKESARISRFKVVNGSAERNSELIILEIQIPIPAHGRRGDIHYGGALRFGPDRMLYLGIGDGSCFECPQTLDNILGKIIRIDVRDATPEQPYRIPDDNPLLEAADARPEIWAYGVRNPWRMSIDPLGGHLWIGDVGQNSEEEVTLAGAGANLGWPILEGSRCLVVTEDFSYFYGVDSLDPCRPPEHTTMPAIVYGHEGEDCAVVGGVVYRGTSIPQMDGVYLFGDFCSGRVWILDSKAEAERQMIQIADLAWLISSFGTDAAGEVYVLTFGGPILRLVEAESGFVPSMTIVPSETVVPDVPRKA